MELISEDRARAFAQALIDCHGNATAAARQLKYEPAKDYGFRYCRHPLVLKALAPLTQAHLSSLTPKAIRTLGHLLDNGSPYVRLEAAKDVLDRNGVGTSREPPKSAQLVVNINLSPAAIADATPVTLDLTASDPVARVGERALENSGSSFSSTSPAHDFSSGVPGTSLAHDFSARVLQPLEETPVDKHQGGPRLEFCLEGEEELSENIESRTKLEETWDLGSE